MTVGDCEKKSDVSEGTARPAGKLVNQSEMAQLLGVRRETIRAWVRQGCPVMEHGGDGRAGLYDTAAVIRWRIEQERVKASAESQDMELEEARRRKLAAEARIAELELAKHAGSLVDKAATERTIFARARMDRDAWLQWPMRVAAEMGAELQVTEGVLLPVLTKEVRAQLDALAIAPLEIPDDD